MPNPDLTVEDELAYAILMLADAYALLTEGNHAQLLTAGGKRALLAEVNEFLERKSRGG